MADPNSCTITVTMDESLTVTANFSEAPADGETPLNMWLIIGSVLGVLVAGGVVYYFVRRNGA